MIVWIPLRTKEEEGWKTRRADSSSFLSDATLPTSGLQRPRNHPSKLGSCSSIDHDGFDQLVGADTEGYQGSSGKVRFVETRLNLELLLLQRASVS